MSGISDADFGWPEPTANEVPVTTNLVVSEPDEQLSAPIRCIHCGELHSVCRERAAELLRSRIRAEARDRLERTESALAGLSEMERIAVARWLQGVLDRPPLANSRAFAYLREVIDALWRDIYWTTPDSLTPFGLPGQLVETEGGWENVEPHHELVDMREGDFVRP